MKSVQIPFNGSNEWQVLHCAVNDGQHACWPAYQPDPHRSANVYAMQIHLVESDGEQVFRLSLHDRQLAVIGHEDLWLCPVELGLDEAIRNVTTFSGKEIEIS